MCPPCPPVPLHQAAQRRGLGGLLRGVALLRGLDEAHLDRLAG